MTADLIGGSSPTSRRRVAWALSLGGVVIGLGATRAKDESYWLDEAVSALVVRRSFRGLAHVLFDQEAGMFAYYIGLWLWAQLFGGDTGLRMFSVVGGAIAASLFYLLAERWFGNRIALAASVMLVTNAYFLRYLTEVRAYSWIMAVALLAVLQFDTTIERNRRRDFVIFGGVVGIGLSMHVLFAILPVCLVLVAYGLKCFEPHPGRKLLFAVVVAAGVFLPSVPALLQRSGQLDWIPPLTVSRGRSQLLEYFGGPISASILLIGLLGGIGFGLVKGEWTRTRVTCVVVAVAFPLSTVVISLFKPLFLARYLAPAFPFLILAATVGLADLARAIGRPRIVGALLTCAATIAIIPFVFRGPLVDTPRGDDPRAAIRFVEQRLLPGDLVLIAHHPSEVLHYLGHRPDIDLGAGESSDEVLYTPRRPVVSFVEQLRRAPTVYLIYWDAAPVEPGVRRLIKERTISQIEPFGSTSVWILVQPG